MDREYRFKSTFVSTASIHVPSEEETKVAKASLSNLRNLLPAGIDPENDPDLLYISADGAVGGLVNRNYDGISKETAIAIVASSKNKYINLEHDKDSVVGVVLYPALTHRETHEILTPEQAAASNEPFNMSFAGVLWRSVSPMVAQYIANQKDSTKKEVLSMSWEILFNEYAIAVGEKDIGKARLIAPTDPTFAEYDKMLLQNGGKGRDPAGQELYRVIQGDAIVLGYGIVANPAAHVKGILPIEKLEATVQTASTITSDTIAGLEEYIRNCVKEELLAGVKMNGLIAKKIVQEESSSDAALQKSEEKNVTLSNTGVTPNNVISMKIETVEQLESVLGKHEATAAVVDFVKAIKDGSKKFEEQLKVQEDLEKASKAAAEQNEKLKTSLEKVQKELDEVRANQETLEANQKFQERMASFDEEFDLDDEDRQIIATQIKDLDDEAFAAYVKSAKKLMAAKSKSMKKEEKKKDEEKKEEMKKEEDCAAVKAALASVKTDEEKKLPNGLAAETTLQDQVNAAFGNTFKIDGKTLSERRATKAKK